MRNPRIRALIEAIEARYSGTRVVVERWGGGEDPDIRWRLWILDVPQDRVAAVEKFASRETTRLYGYGLVPYFAHAVGREDTRKHFAAVVGMPKGRRLVEESFPGYVPARTRRRRRARVA